MKNTESSSMPIKKILIISIIFLFTTIIAINLLPKNNVFSFAKTGNTEINQDSIINENNTENNVVTAEQIIQEYDTIKVATTSRGEGTLREGAEVTPITVEQPAEQYISIQEVTIARDMDLTVRTGLSKEDFKVLVSSIKQDASGFFYDNSDLIYDICEKYELNEVFFCGLIAGESGWNIASNHRKTYNYISLMYKGKLKQFASVEDGLEQAAKALHNNYLSEGGSFYCGKTLPCVQRRFCPNSSTWCNLIFTCMSQMLANR